MLRKLCLLIIFFKNALLLSQVPVWHWAREANSPGMEMAWDVSTDINNGDVYIAGSFDNNLSAKYGPAFTSSYGQKDGFIAKYTSLGNLLWAIKVGGTADDEIKSISIDPFGNVYVAGYFKGTADFDPSAATFTLTPTVGGGNADGFLAKYSSTGSFIWAVKFGGNQADDVWRIYSDSNNVYLAGQYMSTATFSSTNVTTKTTAASQGQNEFFGAKYNNAGVIQWVVSGGSVKDDAAQDIKADASGVYFTGYFEHNFSIYNSSGALASSLNIISPNKPDVFIIKYTQSGNFAWATSAGSSDEDYGYGMAQDANNIYVTGSYRNNTIGFPGNSPIFTKTNQGGLDIFLASISKSSGVYQWASSQTGSGGGDEIAYEIEWDNINNILLTGYFKSNLNYSAFGGPNLSTTGNEDVFVSSFNTSGNFLWSLSAGAGGADIAYGLATYTTGAIYIAGEHAGPTAFGSNLLTPGAGKNIFVAKTGCEIISNNTASSNQTICVGNAPSPLNGSLPIGGSGTYTYTWQQSLNATTWASAAGTNTNQNYSPPPLSVTTYYRRLVDVSGSCLLSQSNTVQITVSPLPSSANAGTNQTVCATSYNLNANAPISGTGLWTVLTGGGSISLPGISNATVTNLSIGQNKFLWTISNGVCFPSTSTVIITRDDFPSPANAGSSQTLCSVSATLNATLPIIGTGVWTTTNSTIINFPMNAATPISNLSVGQNQFIWTITNGVCPPNSDTVFIERDAVPSVANAGADQHICGSNVSLAANTPDIGTGNWNFVSGNGIINGVSNSSATVSALNSGINNLVWTISNGACPPSSDTVQILADAVPTIADAGADKRVCSDQIIFSGNLPVTGTGSWSVVSGSGIILNPNQNNITINNLSVGINSFRWTIENGICPASTDDITIIRDLPPDMAIAGPDQEIEKPVVDLSANTPSVGSGTWLVIEGDAIIRDNKNANATATDLSIGKNIFRWTIQNGVCPDNSDDINISVKPLNIPNGFSPNQDGFNDTFSIPTLEFYPNVKLNVFNRWGGEVYSSNNYKNDWKGTNLSNEKLADDTYYYVLEINKKLNFSGFIILKQNK